MVTPVLAQTDFYKVHHPNMFPVGTGLMYNNLTPRKSRLSGVNAVVVFGIQYWVIEYLIKQWNYNFFHLEMRSKFTPEDQEWKDCKIKTIGKYKRLMDFTCGKDTVPTKHLEDLWDLGYLPLHVKALDEGTLCPIGVPCLTYFTTHPVGYFLPGYLETILSTTVWQPITSATLAHEYKKILNKAADETCDDRSHVQWQAHDFSMRGMSSLETACTSGAGHLLSFTGTDTIPSIDFLEQYYEANIEKELVGASVPATEHSVMCMGEKGSELDTFSRLMDSYPKGILSVVSDTWDLWKVCVEYLPQLKEEILSRDGKLVIRPDSGDPVDIICGSFSNSDYQVFRNENNYETIEDALENYDKPRFDEYDGSEEISFKFKDKYYNVTFEAGDCLEVTWDSRIFETDFSVEELDNPSSTPAEKGVVELLWDTFGGTINSKGYKVLDSHIGAIYGDGITLERTKQICERLKAKGFASCNIVLGIGLTQWPL